MLRASVDGTLSRIMDRQFRHRYGIVRNPVTWALRFPALVDAGWGSE